MTIFISVLKYNINIQYKSLRLIFVIKKIQVNTTNYLSAQDNVDHKYGLWYFLEYFQMKSWYL